VSLTGHSYTAPAESCLASHAVSISQTFPNRTPLSYVAFQPLDATDLLRTST